MKIFTISRWSPLVAALLTLLLTPGVSAQTIPQYVFSANTGTYASLAGATTFSIFAGGGDADDGNSLPLTLPFAFPFAGMPSSSVIVNTNGWLTFNASADPLVINTVLNQAQDRMVAFFGRDLVQTGATFSYRADGTAPNRIFKIQGANISQYNQPGSMGNVQVWLYEAGSIEMRYGAFNGLFATPPFTTTQVGLRGNGANDILALMTDWAAPMTSTSPTATLPLDAGNIPVNGSIFRFDPPAGADLTPPVIGPITVTPPVPGCAPTAHTISVQPTDASGIASARVTYSVGSSNSLTLPMTNVNGTWSATIPAQGTALVTWTVTVVDASQQANATTSAPATYSDGAITVDAGADQTINVGTRATLRAAGSPRFSLKISEFTLNGFGTGATTPLPAYINAADDDLVEIANLSPVAVNLSGYQFEVRGGGPTVNRLYSFPAGTTLGASTVLVLHLGPGTDSPANNYYHTGGADDLLGSGADIGFLLLAPGSVPVDGVAVNNFPSATLFPAGVWNGVGVNSPVGIAGARRNGADTDSNAGWVASSSAARQSIGAPNLGLPAQPLPAVSWTGGVLAGPSTANPLTTPIHTTAGMFTYTVSLTQNGCTVTDQVVVTVVTPVVPTANFSASATSVSTADIVTFTDLSTNLPSTWLWTFTPAAVQFVNGTSDASRNPQVRFLRGGCFTVALTASNPAGADTETKAAYVCAQLAYCGTNLQGSPCSTFNGQINNVSIAGTTLSNLNSGCTSLTGTAYSVYPASGATTATLAAGQTYALTVQSSSTGSIGAWLDANANGVFETSEFILVTAAGMPPTPSTSTVNITVPATTPGGLVGLRIRNSVLANSIAGGDACVTRFSGETEDYFVTLVPACALTAPVVTSNGPVCIGSTLTLTAATQPAGTTYAWTGPNNFTSTAAAPSIPNVTAAAAGSYSLIITRNNCSSPARTLSVVVNALPAAPVGFTLGRCGPGTLRLGFATVPPGTSYRWYSTAAGGAPIAGANALFVTPSLTTTTIYYVSAVTNGCESLTRAVVTARIDPQPVATLVAGGSTTFCTGGSVTLTARGGTSGATYVFRRNGLTIPGTTDTTLVATLGGSYSVVVTNPSTCTAASTTVIVTVNPQSSAAFAYASGTFCRTGTVNPAPIISGTRGGTFTATPAGLTLNATTGQITLATSTINSYTVTYAVTGTCPASQTQLVTITTAPAAGFSYVSTGPVCAGTTGTLAPTLGAGASVGTFTALPAGLSLTASSGVVNLATSQPGTYTVRNTIAASGGCAAATATTTLTVVAAPTAVVTASGLTTFCAGGSVTLTATGGSSYVWSTGATTAAITVATAGTYTVTATNAAGCTDVSVPLTVTVNPQATATFTYSAAIYCVGAGSPATATVTGTAGGTFSATPAGLTLNPTTGAINLLGSAPGTYTVTYAVAGICPASQTQTVTLTPAPQAGFAYATSSGCAGSTGTLNFTTASGATLGTLSILPATGLALDPLSGQVNLAASQAGTYVVSNTVAGGPGCTAATATDTVTILPQPAVAITNLNAAYCSTDAPVTLTGTVDGTAGVGTFAVDGSAATIFNPGLLPVGTYTVVFTGSNVAGCAASTAQTVTISATPPPPVVTVTPQTSGIVLLTSSAPTGNQWLLNGTPIPGATGVTYSVTTSTQSGIYSVISTVGACPSAPSVPQSVTVTGTATALAAATGFQLYPNPTTDGRVLIEVAAASVPQPVLVLDAVGRVVVRATVPAAAVTHALDLRALPVGVYSVRVLTPAGPAVRRLVRD